MLASLPSESERSFMNARSNQRGPVEAPQVSQSPARELCSQESWHKDILDICVEVSGPPTLVAIASNCLALGPSVTGIASMAALLLGVGLSCCSRKRKHLLSSIEAKLNWEEGKILGKHSLLLKLSWLLTAVLAAVLVLVVLPKRAVHLAESWVNWQNELEAAAGECKKGDATCLAERLVPVLEGRPRPVQESDVTGLASDLLAGQLMLANDNAREILNSRLSIGGSFIGTGFSEPAGQTDFSEARVSEYLVPNLSDKSSRVWLWKLDPSQVVNHKPITEHNLMEVLLKFPPVNHANFSGNWSWISSHLRPGDPYPPLVRFAPLGRTVKYSGCLGRSEATRVFMNALGEVSDKTVEDAAKDSGFIISGKLDEEGVRLFVWVYAPIAGAKVTPATWRAVLTNFPEWITAAPCAMEQ